MDVVRSCDSFLYGGDRGRVNVRAGMSVRIQVCVRVCVSICMRQHGCCGQCMSTHSVYTLRAREDVGGRGDEGAGCSCVVWGGG